MSYARSRLYLGMSTVGAVVVLASLALLFNAPATAASWWAATSLSPLVGIAALLTALLLLLFPADVLGGYWLPKRFGRFDVTFGTWLARYARGVTQQLVIYVTLGALLLVSFESLGVTGAILFAAVGMLTVAALRETQTRWRRLQELAARAELGQALQRVKSWGIEPATTYIVEHRDVGFTGGIIGMGRRAAIVLPASWLEFNESRLATIIARRTLAIQSGSYTAGIVGSFLFNLVGFGISAYLATSQASSLAWLVATICCFTIWSFWGLLILPTLSRRASLKMDQSLHALGVPTDLIVEASSDIDRLQDDEPRRSKLIETIFHPIPSVTRRFDDVETASSQHVSWGTWHLARTTLVFSWGCLGLLARAVHCNVGRPELWMMLPSD